MPGQRLWYFSSVTARKCVIACSALLIVASVGTSLATAGCACGKRWPHLWCAHSHVGGHAPGPGDISNVEFGGTWYWLRSPEQERRVTMNLYNRYCIRCHGVDGRGVWDIPDVPDFTNTVWQATRPEAYRSRVILEGRGAVMPSFRGTITLEEACALARYLYTFVPGTEVSRPGLGPAIETPSAGRPPASTPVSTPPRSPAPPPLPSSTPGPFAR
jgi:hypothetical protein